MDAGLYLPFQPLPLDSQFLYLAVYMMPSFKCLLDISCTEAASWFSIYKLASAEDNSILPIPLAKNLSYSFFFPSPAPPLFKSHFEYSIWNSLSQTYVWIAPRFLQEFHQMSCLWKGLSLCCFINDKFPSLLCILHPTFSFLWQLPLYDIVSLLSVLTEKKLEKMGFVFCFLLYSKVQDRS